MIVWLVFLGLVFIAASSGAVFTPGPWYDDMKKPWWNPPKWAFPVVWSILYIMIAIAGGLIWKAEGFGTAMTFWAVQLVLNALWSALFFGMRRMDLAFYEVCFLWISIVGFIVTAWPVSQLAALLFMPYLAWVTTAATLNWTVWSLNPKGAPAA